MEVESQDINLQAQSNMEPAEVIGEKSEGGRQTREQGSLGDEQSKHCARPVLVSPCCVPWDFTLSF